MHTELTKVEVHEPIELHAFEVSAECKRVVVLFCGCEQRAMEEARSILRAIAAGLGPVTSETVTVVFGPAPLGAHGRPLVAFEELSERALRAVLTSPGRSITKPANVQTRAHLS